MRTIFFFFLPFFLFDNFDILNEISREMCFTREKRNSPTEIDINPNTCFQSLCFNILALIVFSKKNESPFVINQKKIGITIREKRNPSSPLADVGPVTELIIHNNGGFDNGTKNLLLLALITVSRTNVENRRIRTSQITFIQIGAVITQKR